VVTGVVGRLPDSVGQLREEIGQPVPIFADGLLHRLQAGLPPHLAAVPSRRSGVLEGLIIVTGGLRDRIGAADLDCLQAALLDRGVNGLAADAVPPRTFGDANVGASCAREAGGGERCQYSGLTHSPSGDGSAPVTEVCPGRKRTLNTCYTPTVRMDLPGLPRGLRLCLPRSDRRS
jgi:hypothetical protein